MQNSERYTKGKSTTVRKDDVGGKRLKS
uniref:Uncharacterized protein n=1 Tax=Rhizophora mucronata TaxID=61149 RepID=A0A2P2J0M9_RHIMU